jgi:hypothetical protein
MLRYGFSNKRNILKIVNKPLNKFFLLYFSKRFYLFCVSDKRKKWHPSLYGFSYEVLHLCILVSLIYIKSTILTPSHCGMLEHLSRINSSIFKHILTCIDLSRTLTKDKFLSKESVLINLHIKETILVNEKCSQINSCDELKEWKTLLFVKFS